MKKIKLKSIRFFDDGQPTLSVVTEDGPMYLVMGARQPANLNAELATYVADKMVRAINVSGEP